MVSRVLVVDDEPDICWALESVLHDAGYEVTIARCKQEAWSLLVGGGYQVAFVDAKLPDGDGIELALEVQERAVLAAVLHLERVRRADAPRTAADLPRR